MATVSANIVAPGPDSIGDRQQCRPSAEREARSVETAEYSMEPVARRWFQEAWLGVERAAIGEAIETILVKPAAGKEATRRHAPKNRAGFMMNCERR